MRIPKLSSRDRRALTIGAVVLVPALAWTLVVAPYLRSVEAASERLAAEREVLRREFELLAAADEYPAVLHEGAERLLRVAERLFGGENPAMAGAALAQYLQANGRESRVLLTRLEPVPAQEAGVGLITLPLRVQGESDLQGLLTLLHSLESGEKLVRVDNLRIQGLRTALASGNGAEVLTFEFTAAGFMLVEPEVSLVENEEGGSGA